MDTKINKSQLRNWGAEIYTLNDEAITNLTDFKSLVNTIPDSYKSNSSEAIINNMVSDLDNAIKCHSDMESLQSFLESVVEYAESA